MTEAAKPANRRQSAGLAGRRQEVVSLADVRLLQVQVIGTDGSQKNVLVYQCGTNVFWGTKMDDLFDVTKRKAAPEWLITGLAETPAERCFRYDGKSYAELSTALPGVASAKKVTAQDDDDAPGVSQG